MLHGEGHGWCYNPVDFIVVKGIFPKYLRSLWTMISRKSTLQFCVVLFTPQKVEAGKYGNYVYCTFFPVYCFNAAPILWVLLAFSIATFSHWVLAKHFCQKSILLQYLLRQNTRGTPPPTLLQSRYGHFPVKILVFYPTRNVFAIFQMRE